MQTHNNWVGKNLNPPTPGTGSVHQLRLDNKGKPWKNLTQSSACLFLIFPDWLFYMYIAC
jgi:hypothetical protein